MRHAARIFREIVMMPTIPALAQSVGNYENKAFAIAVVIGAGVFALTLLVWAARGKNGSEAPSTEGDLKSTQDRKSLTLRRLLLAAGSFVFTLSLIELPAFFNVLDYEGLESTGVWAGLRFIRVPDPELTHLEPPYKHLVGSSRGGIFETLYTLPPAEQGLFRWDLKYDHNGFRNDTDLGSADLVVIGDSMVEGQTLATAELTTSLLARWQGKTVSNLGQYGFGPQQELIVLKRYGLPLKPRLVVWMFTETNDLRDTLSYREIVVKNRPNYWNFFLQRSFTRVVYRSLMRLGAPPKPSGENRFGVLTTSKGKPRKLYFTFDSHSLAADDLDALNEVNRIIQTADKLSADQGARLVFVFVPDEFRVFRDFCRFPEESECRKWELSDLPERMRESVSHMSPPVGYVDLTPALKEGVKQGVLPYYTDDIHLTPDGDRIAAEAINAYINRPTPH